MRGHQVWLAGTWIWISALLVVDPAHGAGSFTALVDLRSDRGLVTTLISNRHDPFGQFCGFFFDLLRPSNPPEVDFLNASQQGVMLSYGAGQIPEDVRDLLASFVSEGLGVQDAGSCYDPSHEPNELKTALGSGLQMVGEAGETRVSEVTSQHETLPWVIALQPVGGGEGGGAGEPIKLDVTLDATIIIPDSPSSAAVSASVSVYPAADEPPFFSQHFGSINLQLNGGTPVATTFGTIIEGDDLSCVDGVCQLSSQFQAPYTLTVGEPYQMATSFTIEINNQSDGQQAQIDAFDSAEFVLSSSDPNVEFLFEMPLGPVADFDEDSDVDRDDFRIWRAGFGTHAGATLDTGDANEDGVVDGKDFLIWQAQFGSLAPASAGAARIPEPTTTALVAMLGVTLATRWRREQIQSLASREIDTTLIHLDGRQFPDAFTCWRGVLVSRGAKWGQREFPFVWI